MTPLYEPQHDLTHLIPRVADDEAAARQSWPSRPCALIVIPTLAFAWLGVFFKISRNGGQTLAPLHLSQLSAKDLILACEDASHDDGQLRWMWGDASIVGHWLAEHDPLRWSSCKSKLATVEELKGYKGLTRPVELQPCQGNSGAKTCMFKSVHAAVHGLGGSFSIPFAYDPEVSRRLALMAHETYCSGRHGVQNWTCERCSQSALKIEPGSVRSFGGMAQDLYGFVAKLQGPLPFANTCLLAIRGTNNLDSLLYYDFDETPTSVPPKWRCSSCYVHAGFLSAWLDLEQSIIDALKSSGCKDSRLVLTGHSLGGALATLGAWPLQHNYAFNVSAIYTYESPRVGTTEFAAAWDAAFSQNVPSFRVTNEGDPVLFLPCRFGEYVHVQYEVHYSKNGTYDVKKQGEQSCSETDTISNAVIGQQWDRHCLLPIMPNTNMCRCEQEERENGRVKGQGTTKEKVQTL